MVLHESSIYKYFLTAATTRMKTQFQKREGD